MTPRRATDRRRHPLREPLGEHAVVVGASVAGLMGPAVLAERDELGKSGFVGAHTVKALLDAGHEVRASARTVARVRRALEPLDCAEAVEANAADILDRQAVRTALAGCDAVVHAAAVFSFDPRRRREMLSANVRGTEQVLRVACEQGLDPVVHVSSVVALRPRDGALTADSPVGRPRVPYALSKTRSEEVARRLQRERAPVAIVYPGSVRGPNDPNA